MKGERIIERKGKRKGGRKSRRERDKEMEEGRKNVIIDLITIYYLLY